MEVILLERINRLGNVGEIVNVKNGFARNFLLPQEKALRASEANKKVFEEQRAEIEAKNADAITEAKAEAKKLDGLAVKLVRQASDEGKLFGSVTVRDVSEQLAEIGYTVPKSKIIITTNIKNTGEYAVKILLHPEVEAIINLQVAKPETAAVEE